MLLAVTIVRLGRPHPIRTSSAPVLFVIGSLPPADLQFDEARTGLRNPAEAQSDSWECRDLLGAGRAGYCHGAVAVNVGLQTAGNAITFQPVMAGAIATSPPSWVRARAERMKTGQSLPLDGRIHAASGGPPSGSGTNIFHSPLAGTES